MRTTDGALAPVTGPGGRFAIAEEVIDGLRLRAYQVPPRTLVELLRETRAFGDSDYLVYGDERVTYAEHLDLVAALAHHLSSEYGIGEGAPVAIAMRNYPEFVLFFWSTLALGGTVVPLNAWWREEEMRFALEDSGAALLVADDERIELLRDVVKESPGLRGTIAVRSARTSEGVVHWEDLRDDLRHGVPLPDVQIDPEQAATILYTSGTTGRSRGVVHSHRNHCTNLLNGQATAALAAAGRPTPGEPSPLPVQNAILAHMPLFHISQLSSLYLGAVDGSKVVLMYKWDVEAALELVERERITYLSGVPLHFQAILDSPSLGLRNLSSLVRFGFAATAIAPEKVARVRQVFGGRIMAGTGYGMTETTSAITTISGQEYWDHPDSVGRPTPVNDIRIVDDAGRDVPPGEAGELWVRGPNVVRGYWNRPEDTAQAFTDGWHHTGDIARVDEEGRVYLVDRLKDVVIRAGENIHTGEVEATMYDHPAVHTVAVVGVPHETLGEEVVAVIRLHDSYSSTTADELRAHVAERLAKFKVPSRIVFVTEDVPRTATGKILKREVREQIVATTTVNTNGSV